MYKLMIVEDEALVREAILKMIDFQKQGFIVVAVCEDGQQAAEQYIQLTPDLVITDICMPFFSGLQLAAMIAEADRGTQVIIITGYDDFNYAKQAIKSQVANYILKPVTPREFEEVLVEARTKLDEQHERRRQISQAQHQLHLSSPLIRDQLLNRLIQGSVEWAEIEQELQSFGLDCHSNFYQVAVIHVDHLEKAIRELSVNQQLLQFMISNVATELATASSHFIAFQLSDGRSALIGAMNDRDALNQMMRDLSRRVIDAIRQFLKISVTIGGGKVVHSIKNLKESFTAAQRNLDHKFLIPDQSILFSEDVRRQTQAIDLSNLEDQIILQVRVRDEAKLQEAIDQFVQAIRLTVQSKSDIQFEWSRLANRLSSAVSSESAETCPSMDQTLPDADDSNYLDRLKSWLIDYCLSCIEIMGSRRNRDNQRLSLLASQYIRDHYADSQLSLMEVCNYASVSLSYFSQLFKEETGKTFIEYLTEIRMDKAKELLRNSSRMLYDIAEMVGYDNPAYFTVAFKKHVGLSPRDYRKQFGQAN